MARPIFKYFGSKYRLSAHYPAPRFGVVCEPFAGSACYSLYHNVKDAILFETDARIFELWRWLINEATEKEVLALPIGLEIGTDLRDVGRRLGLAPGAVELMVRWQRNGNNTCYTVSKWGGPDPVAGLWSAPIRARVAKTLPLVRSWYVERINALEVGNWREQITWFIDPPYQMNKYKYGAEPLNYARLGAWCKGRNGQVIVCEQAGADWLPFQTLKEGCKNMRRGDGATELVYVQG